MSVLQGWAVVIAVLSNGIGGVMRGVLAVGALMLLVADERNRRIDEGETRT